MVKQQQRCISFISFILLLLLSVSAADVGGGLVRKEERKEVEKTEYGSISSVEINDGSNRGPYHLRFITLDPNSLFLPVLLHSDMVFYVQTGSGSLSWVSDDNMNHMDVKRGDVYRIQSGSVFFVRSSLDAEREKLRINAIFTNGFNFEYSQQLYTEPYSSVSNLITGFDKKVLQAAFQVPEEVVDNVTGSIKPPPIVHVASENKTDGVDWTERIFNVLVGGDLHNLNGKKKKKSSKAFNFIDAKPDFKNCNGWSKTMNRKDLKALRGSNLGAFMVNLTQASMMAPHWNPRATEITMVVHGQGMVHVVCSSMANTSECKNRRFKVKEGDVFAVPRFHPMAQMAYNNGTFVFMGFSTMARNNYPQFLAGKSSILQTLDRDILAMSFNVPNATVDELVAAQDDSIILECLSCAEEEERRMQEEKEKERERREEERKRKEEEEARKRAEEEARKREEEEARKRAEEEAMKRAEEEARKREEEEARKRAEEEARKRAEEEARKRAEEEARKREEEEARKRAEEAARKREEEEARKRAEEEARKKAEEEARKREEEEAKKREEEAARKREEEEARRREEEEAAAEREERRRQEEEEARRQEEERRAEEEQQQKEEERRRQEEAAAKRQEKEREEAQRRQEEKGEEMRRREEEEARRQEEEREREESSGGGGEKFSIV